MKQFIKFALVGIINTLVDLGVLNILLLIFRIDGNGTGYFILKSISFACAVTVSYILNKRYVFATERAAGGIRDHESRNMNEKGSFLLVSLIGLVVNATISSAVFAGIHSVRPLFPVALLGTGSALVGTAAVLIFNFFGYKFFVFRYHKEKAA